MRISDWSSDVCSSDLQCLTEISHIGLITSDQEHSMRFIFFATLLVAIPGVASAEPLSFDEALERAAAQAPSLRARALEIDARRSAATAAGQLPDTKLGVGREHFPVSGPPAGSVRSEEHPY